MRQREMVRMARELAGIYKASVKIEHVVWHFAHGNENYGSIEFIISVVKNPGCDLHKFETEADLIAWYKRQMLIHKQF